MGMFLRRGVSPGTKRISTLEVGSSVKISLTGTWWDWLVVHQGLPSSMYDESCNGTWLLLKDVYETRAWHSSRNNTLSSSDIQNYLTNTFPENLPANIRAALKIAKIPYVNGTGSAGTVASGASGLPCYAFMLSPYEVGFTTSDNSRLPVDGAKLDYFESGTGTDALNKRIAYLNGTENNWALRSPYTGNTSTVFDIIPSGKLSTASATIVLGVRPAIILDSNFIVPDDMLAA